MENILAVAATVIPRHSHLMPIDLLGILGFIILPGFLFGYIFLIILFVLLERGAIDRNPKQLQIVVPDRF